MSVKVGLALREEYRVVMFENRVLRRTFGPKRAEEIDWRKLRNEELHNIIVRMVR
jgi:hypothetical protein